LILYNQIFIYYLNSTIYIFFIIDKLYQVFSTGLKRNCNFKSTEFYI